MKKQSKASKRREQFNIQAGGLSDLAYLMIEDLSKRKLLTKKFVEWAEREVAEREGNINPSSNVQMQTQQDPLTNELHKQVLELQKQLGMLMNLNQMNNPSMHIQQGNPMNQMQQGNQMNTQQGYPTQSGVQPHLFQQQIPYSPNAQMGYPQHQPAQQQQIIQNQQPVQNQYQQPVQNQYQQQNYIPPTPTPFSASSANTNQRVGQTTIKESKLSKISSDSNEIISEIDENTSYDY